MATYAAYRHVELDNVGYGKKRVLKPPGGGSSDIFGSPPEKTSPRRAKGHNQSSLGSGFFGDATDNPGKDNGGGNGQNSNNKPGNDSYSRLFGPPDAPSTTCTNNHMRSNISLSAETSNVDAPTSPRSVSKMTASSILNGDVNDNTGGSSCMPRNPVTGDGIEVTPPRRSARKCRDGNPVTGLGYANEPSRNNGPAIQNGRSSSNSSSSITEKSSTDSSPASTTTTTTTGQQNKPAQPRTRVPPGGYSSGLW